MNELAFGRSANRADTRAGTAVNAGIRIDHHVITFSDSRNGAFAYTGAASNTSIFINNVSHFFLQL